MTNLGGWFFTLLALGIFYATWLTTSRSIWVLITAFIAIFSHQALSILNVLYGPFPFAALDAASFHLHAIQRIELPDTKVWSIGSSFYKSLLASVYNIFGVSLWLGQAFSIVFFAASCAILMLFSQTIRLNSLFVGFTLLLFGLLPSSLMFGSFTLRETFMTVFFILGVCVAYLAIYDNARERQWRLYSFAVISFFIMGLFHMVLLVYAIIISFLLFIVLYGQKASFQKVVFQTLCCLVGIGVFMVLVKEVLPVHLSDDYFAMLRIQVNGDVVPIPHAISVYHQTANATGADTQYAAALEFTTWGRMFVVFFYSYVFYLGWPLTGDYSQLSTWVIMAEAIFRLLGLVSIVLLAKTNKQWYWLIFAYLSLTFLWNIGTSNHGQALRHHVMTEWILVLALFSYVQQNLSRNWRHKFKH